MTTTIQGYCYYGPAPINSLKQASVLRALDGSLVLRAGSKDDRIQVTKGADGLYHVNVNGQDFRFTKSQMARLRIEGGAGNDKITVGPNVDVPVRVSGGRGDDKITNFAQGATLDGGFGNDKITNFARGATIDGGFGNDRIQSFASGTSIKGGFGDDQIVSRGHGTSIDGGFGSDTIDSRGIFNAVKGGFGIDRIFSNGQDLGDLSSLRRLFGSIAPKSPAEQLSDFATPAGYGPPSLTSIDLAQPSSAPFGALFARLQAKQLERRIMSDPMLRGQLEARLGGQIVSDGSIDGKLTVVRPQAQTNLPCVLDRAFPGAGAVMGFLSELSKYAAPAANPFLGAMLTAMNQLGGDFGQLGGAGAGSLNPNARPGLINNNDAASERAHQSEVDGVLNDPSLTVEDRVMLMLMLVMKKADRDIQKQSDYINQVQQQQGAKANGGAGGGGVLSSLPVVGGLFGGGGGQEGAPSIDLESQKLSRMVTKRSQMFDTLKSIMDKYNETAKGVIQSMGR
ncbi:MAG: hypothetical protein HYV07_00200 [Deltaproteobacteria bacterium]|nr:hypothetical protein [Deltaproteobacteria bacterium]